MPWALGAGLGEAGAAAFLALLCIAVVYLLRAIAAILPRINFGVIVIDFGKIFLAIVNPVVSWLVGATNELWSDAAWWMHGIAYIATGLFDDVRDGFVHAYDQIDHVVTSVIPDAVTKVYDDATGVGAAAVKALEADIVSASKTLTGDISRAAAREYADAKTLVHDARTALLHAVGAAVSTGETYTDDAIAKVREWAQGAFADIGAIPRELVAGIDYVTPAALAGVAAGVVAITSEFESCAVTTCEGGNNFSNLLQDALGIASFAIFAEWIKGAINDPAAAEATFASAASGLYSDADSLLDSLLSL